MYAESAGNTPRMRKKTIVTGVAQRHSNGGYITAYKSLDLLAISEVKLTSEFRVDINLA